MENPEAWHTARTLVRMYGDDAIFIAGRRAHALFDLADAEGFREWAEVVRVLNRLDHAPLPPMPTQ